MADRLHNVVTALSGASTAPHGVRQHLDGPGAPDLGGDE
ncbi:hypothetical protein C8E95_6946 [Pseudonocardia autotrophica]|uniref:Uncharacterized protein n=2 Tax=Pseudonocardia TaxID=1847 RepID=A0A1Y2MQ75_PSEAH|nr:hypothetical protein [Pseudonocardia parietis]OSY36628.1 hypothetical protein BG845_05233 [Pseudonocardia autotrophica]TDN65458.1 hypothetical protein C8E95_6946 [Pseudonocardia autotrophica]